MTNSSRVLFVTPALTARPRSGGTLRSLRLIEALTPRAAVEIVVVGACDDPEELKTHTNARSVAVFDDLPTGARKRLLALTKRIPLTCAAVWHDRVADIIETASAEGTIVVLDFNFLGVYLPAAKGRCVLNLHNVEQDLAPSHAHRPGLHAVEGRLASHALARREQRWVRLAGVRTVVVSPRDRTLLGTEAVVVPNGTDLPDQVTPVPSKGPIVFIGALDYTPNLIAVRHWVEDIWPRIPQHLRMPLTVVGRSPGTAFDDLRRHPGVELVGEVADVTPYLATAALVVIPLTLGGGTRLKVLEALAHGRPVLATPKAVEGLPNSLSGARIEDDADAFAAALVTLLGDAQLRVELGQQARISAHAFDWKASQHVFATAVLEW